MVQKAVLHRLPMLLILFLLGLEPCLFAQLVYTPEACLPFEGEGTEEVLVGVFSVGDGESPFDGSLTLSYFFRVPVLRGQVAGRDQRGIATVQDKVVLVILRTETKRSPT